MSSKNILLGAGVVVLVLIAGFGFEVNDKPLLVNVWDNIASNFGSAAGGAGGVQGGSGNPTPYVASGQEASLCAALGKTYNPQTDGKQDVDVTIVGSGTLNISDEYLAGTVWFGNRQGQGYTSATVASFAASKPAPSTLSVAAGVTDGVLYLLSDSSVNGKAVYNVDSCKAADVPYSIVSSKNTQLKLHTYTRTGATDNNATSTIQDATAVNTTTYTLGQGELAEGKITLTRVDGGSAWGTEIDPVTGIGGGIIYCDIFDTGSVSPNAVNFFGAGIQKTLDSNGNPACPVDVAATGAADVCFSVPRIADATTRDVSWSVESDLGNPGATGDVRCRFNDYAYHFDDDIIKHSVFDGNRNDEGVAYSELYIDLA